MPRAHAWAIDVQDEGDGARVRLVGTELVVGTARGADIVLSDGAVSGRHCAVSVLGGGVAIRDLGSRNGTFVGGARVKEAWGGAGTIVTVGRSTLVVSAIDDAEDDEPLSPALAGIAGASAPMRRVAAQIRRLARHSAPVLIAGESGTGKELVARALHDEGPRRAGPFVALNVAALPRELVESEMFGHERGAFTGAVARRDGAFRDAAKGSLFLDEIGRAPHRGPAEAPAGARWLRDPEGRRVRLRTTAGRARHRRDARPARVEGGGGKLSPRPLPPPRGVRRRGPAAAGAQGRHRRDRTPPAPSDGARARSPPPDVCRHRAAPRARLAGQRARAAQRALPCERRRGGQRGAGRAPHRARLPSPGFGRRARSCRRRRPGASWPSTAAT